MPEIYHIGIWEGPRQDQWHELASMTNCTREQAERHADSICDRTEFFGEWYCYTSIELRAAQQEVRGDL